MTFTTELNYIWNEEERKEIRKMKIEGISFISDWFVFIFFIVRSLRGNDSVPLVFVFDDFFFE